MRRLRRSRGLIGTPGTGPGATRTVLVLAVAVALMALMSSGPAGACTTCLGDPDSPATRGMNNAILTLLGVVGTVQVGFVALFWQVRQRSKRLRKHRESFDLIDGGVS